MKALKNGESKFGLPPLEEGGSKKMKKGNERMVQVQVFLKGGLTLFLLKFSRFIIFTFRNYFTLCKIVLCTCEENFFFCHDIIL